MKFNIIILTILSFYFVIYSNEINKSDYELSGLINFSINKDYTTLNSRLTKEYSFQLNPHLGYYLSNKFYMGPSISAKYSYMIFENSSAHANEYTLGPGIYFGVNVIKIRNFYPYLQTGIEYNYIRIDNSLGNYHNDGYKISVDSGLKILIGLNLVFYLQLGYNHQAEYYHSSDYREIKDTFDLSFGIGGLIKRTAEPE